MKKLLVTAAVAAAVCTPVAQAGGRPDDRALPPRSLDPVAASHVPPNDRALPPLVVVEPVQTAIRPDDRAGGRGPVDAPVVGGTPVSSPGDGFDWTDGAIGAATASGVLLLLSGGAALLMLRRRGRVAL